MVHPWGGGRGGYTVAASECCRGWGWALSAAGCRQSDDEYPRVSDATAAAGMGRRFSERAAKAWNRNEMAGTESEWQAATHTVIYALCSMHEIDSGRWPRS